MGEGSCLCSICSEFIKTSPDLTQDHKGYGPRICYESESWTQGDVVISLSLLKILECRVAFNSRINCSSVEGYPETHSAVKIAHVPWVITVTALSTSVSQLHWKSCSRWLSEVVAKVPAAGYLSFTYCSGRNNNLFYSVLISFSGNLTSHFCKTQREILNASLKAAGFMAAALRLCFRASHITYSLAWLCWALYNDSYWLCFLIVFTQEL